MPILVDFRVDKDLYFNPQTKHYISMVTTEYIYKNNMLVHLQLSNDYSLRINNLLQRDFSKEKSVSKEQFFLKNTNSKNKNISRTVFKEKLKKFDMTQTATEQEILEDYIYTNRNDTLDKVQIAVKIKDEKMTAGIEFKNIEQYEYFICPAWLLNI